MEQFDAFIFTHIPKCGGSSFRNYIYRNGIESKISFDNIYIPGEGEIPVKNNIRVLPKKDLKALVKKDLKIIADHSKYEIHKTANIDTIKKPFYFTIFREPISRFISHYNYFYKNQNYGNCGGKSFSSLNHRKKVQVLNALENLQVSYLAPHKKRGRNCNKHDFLFALDVLNNGNLSYGILENMEGTLKTLKYYSPDWIKWDDSFPFLNKNNNTLFDVDDSDIELIKAYHKFDLDLYDFLCCKFDLVLKYI